MGLKRHVPRDRLDSTSPCALGGGDEMEFECRTVRGAAGENRGYSCVNNPPSEMLLINPARGRYHAHRSIGGWTFYAPEASLFVEYGTCMKQVPPGPALVSRSESGAGPEPEVPSAGHLRGLGAYSGDRMTR